MLLILVLTGITVSGASQTTLTPFGDFLDYQKNLEDVANLLNMEKDGLLSFCSKNNIRGLWVNKDNTQQIRLSYYNTDFSNSVVNISTLSDDKITELVPDITGIGNVKGEIVLKGNQKFIKLQLISQDSGGDYNLTQYITVANKELFVLSFYTAIDDKTDYIYIEKTFDSFDSPYFLTPENGSSDKWQYIILIGAIVFALLAIVIGMTVIRDIKNERSAVSAPEPTEAEN